MEIYNTVDGYVDTYAYMRKPINTVNVDNNNKPTHSQRQMSYRSKLKSQGWRQLSMMVPNKDMADRLLRCRAYFMEKWREEIKHREDFSYGPCSD